VYGVADLGYGKAYAALYRVGFPTYVIIQPVTVSKSQTNRNMMLAVHPVTGRISVDGFHTYSKAEGNKVNRWYGL
jgi:hypothetical protein